MWLTISAGRAWRNDSGIVGFGESPLYTEVAEAAGGGTRDVEDLNSCRILSMTTGC